MYSIRNIQLQYSTCTVYKDSTVYKQYIYPLLTDGHGLPELHQLSMMESSKGKVKVIESTAPIWKKLALALKFPQSIIDIIQANNDNKCENACREMLGRWLNGTMGTRQPVVWQTLIDVLEECDKCELARSLLDATL